VKREQPKLINIKLWLHSSQSLKGKELLSLRSRSPILFVTEREPNLPKQSKPVIQCTITKEYCHSYGKEVEATLRREKGRDGPPPQYVQNRWGLRAQMLD
jgi:hypothetical protein